ncbi:UDP-N-acetylmuramoyl-L-alanyl-D-glutamate--2,6-diaminopimelate ligase, partial|nr:UDP-N-acetylmuramoyl-L-alanyl-D-glutamate--2,6-diaminopimelate ligase [Escherichia coli]
PIMAQVSCDMSDKVIFTSDNPRTEDATQILRDMEEGLTSAAKRKYISIVDRKEAIKTAVGFAKEDDIILVAGKGHEKYQDIGGVKHPFDDKEVLKEMFELLGK